MDRPAEDQIRERAHQLWEAAGRPEGRQEEFWQQAEREICGREETNSAIDRNQLRRELYRSPNGDCWYLGREPGNGSAFIIHQPILFLRGTGVAHQTRRVPAKWKRSRTAGGTPFDRHTRRGSIISLTEAAFVTLRR